MVGPRTYVAKEKPGPNFVPPPPRNYKNPVIDYLPLYDNDFELTDSDLRKIPVRNFWSQNSGPENPVTNSGSDFYGRTSWSRFIYLAVLGTVGAALGMLVAGASVLPSLIMGLVIGTMFASLWVGLNGDNDE